MTKRKRIWFAIGAVFLLALIVWVIWADTALEINTYTISSPRLPESFDGFRIAHLSDIHNGENEDLLPLLRQTQPDIIVITGDLIDSRDTQVEIALALVQEAVQIAPCYYVTGNHEVRVPGEYRQLKDGMEAAGVIVLENAKTQICLEGQAITVIGVDDPSYETEYPVGNSAGVIRKHLDMLQSDGDGFALLLSHRPELFETYVDCGIDLVLSGHAHGGQIRLPFIGGLIAPGQGLFPEYDAGLFEEGNCRMIVSRGIGSSSFPFRFNNRPEIVLIELKNQSP